MLKTANGNNVPMIGLGTFPFEGEVMADMVKTAMKIGYRLFDTADDYRGEPGIGQAIKDLEKDGLFKRQDLFIQTKISDNNAHEDEPLTGVYFNPNSSFMKRHTAGEVVREKVTNSLRDLGTDYLDSILIHYPYPYYYVDIWKELIKLKQEGIVRYIGVSNFHERHINRLIEETGVSPEINEVYTSPIATKQKIVDYCRQHDCLFITYSPLMDLASGRVPVEPLMLIAHRYHKSVAQIILRWNIDRGCMPLPKSKNPERLKENFDIWDFSLSKDEVDLISSLNIDYQYLVESKICPGI